MFAGLDWTGLDWTGLDWALALRQLGVGIAALVAFALTLADVGAAWAADAPYHQTVEVQVTGVRFHESGDRYQSAEVSINGQLSALVPLTLTECGGLFSKLPHAAR